TPRARSSAASAALSSGERVRITTRSPRMHMTPEQTCDETCARLRIRRARPRTRERAVPLEGRLENDRVAVDRAIRPERQIAARACNQRVARIIARRNGSDDEVLHRRGRQVLQRVHSEVDLAMSEGPLDRGYERPVLELADRLRRTVPRGLDHLQLEVAAE